jgi:preprotein translocase subunit YajC
MLFTSTAYAQDAAAAMGESSSLAGLLPVIIMIALFYVLLIRPQQKKLKNHKNMVDALQRGDKVITAGGIYGKVAKVEDTTLMVEIADEVKIKLDKNSIATVIDGAAAAAEDSAGKEKPSKKAKKTAEKDTSKLPAKAAND